MEELISSIKERFPNLEIRHFDSEIFLSVSPEILVECAIFLKEGLGFSVLHDLVPIDQEEGAFLLLYSFLNVNSATYVRISVECEGTVPSLTDLYGSANWQERECYDMMGIQFEGHPDLRRLLMWDGFEGYPLLKNFPLAGVECELPNREFAEDLEAKVKPADQRGGIFLPAGGRTVSSREPCPLDGGMA